MDLASGARRVIVTMTHTNKDGTSKIVPECDLPLTARNVVDVVITDLAIFRFSENALCLTALMPGIDLEEVKAKTSAQFRVLFDAPG